MFDHRALRFIIIFILWPLIGCTSLSGEVHDGAGDFEAPGDMDSDGACIVEEGVDSDNDGLLDIYEDLNRNCLVDEGETDPYNPDSDGDGLLDGDEDADGNGVWDADRGELNPLLKDTDGNGTPDAEEPKAQVCNRAHADRAIAERRILPSNGVLYVHPEIKEAAPFGDTNVVFLRGHEEESAAILFDSPLEPSTFRELIGALSDGLFGSNEESFIELNNIYENHARGTVEAHLRLKNHRLSIDRMIGFLAEYVPELKEPMALRHAYQPTSMNWDVQLLGEQFEDGTRWAMSWKPAEASDAWLSIVRPTLLGTGTRRTVRFVCENVNVRSRAHLNVLLVIDEDAMHYAEYWIRTLNEMVRTRTERGSTTIIHALRANEEGQLGWHPANEEVATTSYELLLSPLYEQPFDQLVTGALQALPPTLDGEGDDVLVLVISGRGDYDSEEDREELPELPDVLRNARMVVASPTQAPFSCPWRMSDMRADSVQRLVNWGHARHVGNCESYTTGNSDKNKGLITALAAVRWDDTERAPIPGTLWLSDEWLSESGQSVPATIHSVAGSRVVLAPDAKGSANTAVSFAAWFE